MEAILCNKRVKMENSHLADMVLTCTVVTDHISDVICLTATFGSKLRFWVTWGENLSDAVWEVAAWMEDSKERPRQPSTNAVSGHTGTWNFELKALK